MRDYNIARLFKGTNMVTPHAMEFGTIAPGLHYELSWGEGILDRNHKLYGVTLADDRVMLNGDSRNKMFHTLTDAREYIESLRKELDN